MSRHKHRKPGRSDSSDMLAFFAGIVVVIGAAIVIWLAR